MSSLGYLPEYAHRFTSRGGSRPNHLVDARYWQSVSDVLIRSTATSNVHDNVYVESLLDRAGSRSPTPSESTEPRPLKRARPGRTPLVRQQATECWEQGGASAARAGPSHRPGSRSPPRGWSAA